jgi:hypothetical protein
LPRESRISRAFTATIALIRFLPLRSVGAAIPPRAGRARWIAARR